MLTDVEFVFLDWKDPQKRRALKHVTPEELSKYSFADGTMGPKVFAAVEFVKNGGKWAAIGSLQKLHEIIDGSSGTRIIQSEEKRKEEYVPYNIKNLPKTWPPVWPAREIYSWLTDVVELPEFYIGVLQKRGILDNPVELLSLNRTMIEKMGIPFSIAQALHSSITAVRKYIHIGPEKGEFGFHYVASSPYPWPFNGKLERTNTVVLAIDMQEDFAGLNGYFAKMGYNVDLTRAPIPFISNIFQVCRQKGIHIIHTREGHRPTLDDLPENKRWRSEKIHAGIGSPVSGGSQILVRGQPGWDIIEELYPLPNEVIIDKPGKGAFYATDLDLMLKLRKIQNLILTGVTTDVCVHTTMREANDRGYECLLVEDATAAASRTNHRAAISMVHMSGGIFGATSTTAKLLDVLQRLPDFEVDKPSN